MSLGVELKTARGRDDNQIKTPHCFGVQENSAEKILLLGDFFPLKKVACLAAQLLELWLYLEKLTRGEVVYKTYTVKMVVFMLDASCKKPLAYQFVRYARRVEIFKPNGGAALDFREYSGK